MRENIRGQGRISESGGVVVIDVNIRSLPLPSRTCITLTVSVGYAASPDLRNATCFWTAPPEQVPHVQKVAPKPRLDPFCGVTATMSPRLSPRGSCLVGLGERERKNANLRGKGAQYQVRSHTQITLWLQ